MKFVKVEGDNELGRIIFMSKNILISLSYLYLAKLCQVECYRWHGKCFIQHNRRIGKDSLDGGR
jgi:hypothetical protein